MQQGGNAQLRTRVQELSSELQDAQEELEALRGVHSDMEASLPSAEKLVQAAVQQERAVQEARNRKVLELLNNKVRWQ